MNSWKQQRQIAKFYMLSSEKCSQNQTKVEKNTCLIMRSLTKESSIKIAFKKEDTLMEVLSNTWQLKKKKCLKCLCEIITTNNNLEANKNNG